MGPEQQSGSKGRRPSRRRGRRPRREKGRRRRFKKGIYLLPGFFTVSNLFFGFLSIIATMHCLNPAGGEPTGPWSLALAAGCIGIAALLDALDGRVARLANATSQFGVEFDSLSDIISFGMAPSLLIYVWGLQSLGRVGWLTAFIYLVCCSARLARFNIRVDSGTSDPRFFTGMPSPAAACFLASLVFFIPDTVGDKRAAVAVMALAMTVSFLMVSNIRYSSFKRLGLKDRRPYIFVVLVGLVLVAVAAAPQEVLLGLALTYLVSGPIRYVASRPALARRRKAGSAAEQAESEAGRNIDANEHGALGNEASGKGHER